MDFNTECFVSGGLAAVLRLTRIAGIAPLNFLKTRDGWRIRLSTGWSIYGFFMVTVINFVTISSLVAEMQLNQESTIRMRDNTQRLVWIVQASFITIASCTAVYTAPGLMRSMIPCLNQMQKVNSELNICHLPMNLGRNMTKIAIVQGMACVLISLMNYGQVVLSGYQINQETWINLVYIVYFFSFWILQLRNLQFIVVVLYVKYSFTVVNKELLSVLKDLKNSKITPLSKEMINVIKKYNRLNYYIKALSGSGKTYSAVKEFELKSNHRTVRRLSLVFAALCNVVHDVNRTHGPMVLVILSNFFLHLICTPYFFIIYLLEEETSGGLAKSNIRFSIQLLWCLYHTFNLVTIIEPCHLTHMEMNKTRELVGHLMRCTHSIYDPLAIESEQFFRYLLLNEASYEPLKLFKMTRTLIFTILGSISTYTVVILHI